MFLLELLVLGLKCWKTQTYFEKTWTLLTHIMVQGQTLSTFLKQSLVCFKPMFKGQAPVSMVLMSRWDGVDLFSSSKRHDLKICTLFSLNAVPQPNRGAMYSENPYDSRGKRIILDTYATQGYSITFDILLRSSTLCKIPM